jgi:hypothetical protein
VIVTKSMLALVAILAVCAAACETQAGNPVAVAPRSTSAPFGRPFFAEPGADLPDLTIDAARVRRYATLHERNFTAGDCALIEQCVGGIGRRKLLSFDVMTPNIGTADLVLGNPANNRQFEFSACHGHYHYSGYANYELLSSSGTAVVTGRKQAFCLEDSIRNSPGAAASRYTCTNQGISAGWADDYYPTLDCQWLDVTNVPSGSYQLRVTINPLGTLPDANTSNNVAVVPIVISPELFVQKPRGRK